MQYNIFLKRDDGTFKVSGTECRKEEASRQLALYLFRHYPVRFFDDKLGEDGDTEKVLRDSRSGLVIWRQGDLECKLPEGFFYIDPEKKDVTKEKWWEVSLPKSKKLVIEIGIQEAYKKGYREGYSKGVDDGKDEGYRQGIHDRASILN